MPTIRVEPSGIAIAADAGETVIEAAWRAGVDWPTECFARAECRLCLMRVQEGSEHMNAPGAEERAALRQLPPSVRKAGNARLACRSTTQGDIVVKKSGVRRRTED